MKLLLFDIDGTLLHTNGHGRRMVQAAAAEVLNREVDVASVPFAGRTDPAIMREILNRAGINSARIETTLSRALATYVDMMHSTLTSELVSVLPGVRALLTALRKEKDIQMSLLTGNLQQTAYLKLSLAGISPYFPFGAFGSDHADRHALPEVALARAANYFGSAASDVEVVIIGDTHHDVQCGRPIGAFSVAVCTGLYDRAFLETHDPHVLLDDLADLPHFYRAVLDRVAPTDGAA